MKGRRHKNPKSPELEKRNISIEYSNNDSHDQLKSSPQEVLARVHHLLEVCFK